MERMRPYRNSQPIWKSAITPAAAAILNKAMAWTYYNNNGLLLRGDVTLHCKPGLQTAPTLLDIVGTAKISATEERIVFYESGDHTIDVRSGVKPQSSVFAKHQRSQ